MIAMIVTGHGKFASAMESALHVIAGEQPDIKFIDFDDDSTTNLENNLQAAITSFEAVEGILIVSDLTGGSPFKISVECAYKNTMDIEVIGGVNLPMIIELAMTRRFISDLEEFTETALRIGKDSIVRFALEKHQQDEDGDGI